MEGQRTQDGEVTCPRYQDTQLISCSCTVFFLHQDLVLGRRSLGLAEADKWRGSVPRKPSYSPGEMQWGLDSPLAGWEEG